VTWVEDGIYAAGGEHLPAAWSDFADQTGITAIIHMRPGKPAPFQGPLPGAFLWLALENECQADLAARQLAAEFINLALAEKRRLLLHSSLGRHRTRWAFVAYQLKLGKPLPAVLQQAGERPWMGPYRTDQAEWEIFAAGTAGRTALSHPEGGGAIDAGT
jgi:hypothetical protein